MTQIHRFKNGSSEWLDLRTKYVTGTEVASLFGFNPNLSSARVLKDKISPPVRIDNQWMRAGRLLEPAVFIALNEIGIPAVAAAPTGEVVFITHDESRIGASMDGKLNSDQGFFIVEAKTTKRDKFVTWVENPPLNYVLQVQTQMLVAGVEQSLLACLCYELPFPLIVYQIKANKDIQQLITHNVTRFWDCYKEDIKFEVNKDDKEQVKSLIYQDVESIFMDNRLN